MVDAATIEDDFADLVPPCDVDALRYNWRTRAYEITPSFRLRTIVQDVGFQQEGLTGKLYYTHLDQIARSIPEWELLADPDTYARLKTNG